MGLSILYLRCGAYIRGVENPVSRASFNSLFEMLTAAKAAAEWEEKKLSILYLRCKDSVGAMGGGSGVGVLSILYLRCSTRLALVWCCRVRSSFQFSI